MPAIQTSNAEASSTESVATSQVTLPAFNQSLLSALLAADTDRRLPSDRPGESECRDRLVIDAEEVTFRVGRATLSLTKENGGTLEIRAAHVRIHAEEILSEAEGTNTIAGEHVV